MPIVAELLLTRLVPESVLVKFEPDWLRIVLASTLLKVEPPLLVNLAPLELLTLPEVPPTVSPLLKVEPPVLVNWVLPGPMLLTMAPPSLLKVEEPWLETCAELLRVPPLLWKVLPPWL